MAVVVKVRHSDKGMRHMISRHLGYVGIDPVTSSSNKACNYAANNVGCFLDE